MNKAQYSLKWRLVLSITCAFVLIWAVAFAWLYYNLEHKMTETLDERLSASAHMVARLLGQIPIQQLKSAAEPVVSELNNPNLIACVVSVIKLNVVLDHAVVAQTKGAPKQLAQQTEGFRTWDENGVAWRSFTLREGQIQVVAAERILLREALLTEILKSILWPLCLTLILCIGLILWIIKKEFKPIEKIAQFLQYDQSVDNSVLVQQLDSAKFPLELHSFIENISSLLGRLQQSLENEKNFSAYAAHELRSPLTAIKINVQLSQLLIQQYQDDKLTMSLNEAEQSIQRYQHLLEQLLFLSKTEHQQAEYTVKLSLKDILKQVLQELAPLYLRLEERIEIDWESLGEIYMSEQALKIVVFNVVENALKHAKSYKKIQIRQQQQTLIIEDFGIGLNQQDLGLATQRFWRKSAQTQGHGLGLALTQALMQQHHYHLYLEAKQEGGLLVKLVFQ
ncbi:HAMP domain-containing sensor histidine kinase [Acinetobacter rudis]|uniref:sensor histidine kinase n=1 Tax=Acinetobacter rudis TaxID=632955 RepID=UPI00280EC6A3|nr:HAMP domain-containing sensor histidine kinase [Acinetobacter rudis]MDQ8953433.1 HAMP domain-containing sensor histidine kinase [Acinetobacter rudis]